MAFNFPNNICVMNKHDATTAEVIRDNFLHIAELSIDPNAQWSMPSDAQYTFILNPPNRR